MSWHELVSEGFGPQRDGEPPDLRGDIADELNDHLDCSMHREMSRTDEVVLARQIVLDRFGDPKRLAARLWFDAMKETVMKDRILFGTVALLAIACIAVCAMMWVSLQRSEKVNQELLGALTDLRQASARPAATTDRTELAVRVLEETEQGPAVADATIMLDGNPLNPAQEMRLTRTTDKDGLAVFPPVLLGRYALRIETAGLRLRKRIVVMPGGDRQTETFISPRPLPQAPIAVDVEWPKQLRRGELFLRCVFEPVRSELAHGDEDWTVREPFILVLSISGRLDRAEQLVRRTGSRPGTCPIKRAEPLKHDDVGKLPIGAYRLDEISVLTLDTERSARQKQPFFTEVHQQYFHEEKPGPSFEAKLGAENRWSIPISDQLVDDVLAGLDVDDSKAIPPEGS